MKKLLFAFLTLLVVAFALPNLAQASLSPDQMREARSRLNGAIRAGVPLDQVVCTDPDNPVTGEAREELKRHRVIKGKDWNAMTDEQKKTAIDNLNKTNPNSYYIDIRTGDIYSVADDPSLNKRIRGSTFYSINGKLKVPDGILTSEEGGKRQELEERDRERRHSQPDERPDRDSGDVSHDD